MFGRCKVQEIYTCICVPILSVSMCASWCASSTEMSWVCNTVHAWCTRGNWQLPRHGKSRQANLQHVILRCPSNTSYFSICPTYHSCPDSLPARHGGCWPRCYGHYDDILVIWTLGIVSTSILPTSSIRSSKCLTFTSSCQSSSYSAASSPVSWLISVVPNTASSHGRVSYNENRPHTW